MISKMLKDIFSVPHYRVKSRELKAGVLSKPLNGLRSLLVGGLYRHMGEHLSVLHITGIILTGIN